VIQLTDDEKFLFKADLKLEECHRYRAPTALSFCQRQRGEELVDDV
jgi:hypothetical protein